MNGQKTYCRLVILGSFICGYLGCKLFEYIHFVSIWPVGGIEKKT